jgi:hypothetical protein
MRRTALIVAGIALAAAATSVKAQEAATANLSLLSTGGTSANPVFNYSLTLDNTGTTNIGTFWYAWVPGEDFLPSVPSNVTAPAGWHIAITGAGNSLDGSAIQFEGNSNFVAPGGSLGGFDFSSPDTLAALAGSSPSHPSVPAQTFTTYTGGTAFSGAAFTSVATETAVPEPASCGLLILAGSLLCARRPGRAVASA